MGTWAADGQVTGAAAQASISCRCKCGVFPTALYLKLGDRPHAHAHARVNVIKRKNTQHVRDVENGQRQPRLPDHGMGSLVEIGWLNNGQQGNAVRRNVQGQEVGMAWQ